MPRTQRSATATTDHDKIRRWVEQHGGKPAAVKRATRGDAGILRIDFPGFSGQNLKHISWDEWFETFDKAGLAFLHRDRDRFNKLVSRESARESESGKGSATKRTTRRPVRRTTARTAGSKKAHGTGRRSTKRPSRRSSGRTSKQRAHR